MKFNFKILSFLLVFTLTILTAQSQMPIVLEDATVIDSWNTVPVTNCYIVITGNKISNIGKSNEIVIPENAQKFNMKGKYVIPGLVDVASRFRSEKELNQLLSWGVTGTNYLFESIKEARQLSLRTKPDTARTPEVYITTPVFGASGEANEGVTVRPTTPEDARSQVRVLHSLKISRFHILYDEHQLDSAVVAALIDEAKKLKIFVSIQVSLMKDAQAAIDAGVSALVRGAVDERLGSSLLDQLIRRNIYYVSTLSWYESLTDEENYFANIFADSLFRLSLPQSEVTAFTQTDAIKIVHQQFPRFKFTPEQRAIAYDNSGAIVKHYVPVPMGTDVSFLPGISEHLELEYLVNAGLTPMQAIVSATAISAEYLGVRKNVGFLFTNYQADMIVLERNPLEDIRNTRAISMIIKKGKIFYPKELRGEAKN